VHTDIKPDNILCLNDDGDMTNVTLIDFGLSQRFSNGVGGHIVQRKDLKRVSINYLFCSKYQIQESNISRRDDII
jgi:serine/threonine protein kinase